MFNIDGKELYWSSDWLGYEVGYNDVGIVGLYSDNDGIYYYIDMDSGDVLESWIEPDD